MLKAVSIDLWGTLLKSNPEFHGERDRILAENDLDPALWSRFKSVVQTAIPYPSATSRMVWLLSRMGEEMGMTSQEAAERASKIAQELWLIYPEHPPLILKEAVELLCHIQIDLKIPICISSNVGLIPGAVMSHTVNQTIYDAYNKGGVRYVDIEYEAFDDNIGASKPSGAFFSCVHRGFKDSLPDIQRDEILHIGDDQRCDGGAVAYGMQFLRVYDVHDFVVRTTEFLEQERSNNARSQPVPA